MNNVLTDPKKIKNVKIAIYSVSILVPIVVAILFKIKIPGVDLTFLPRFYATINGLTAVYLTFALIAIKRKNPTAHRRYIRLSFLLSIIFLVCYVAYHMTSDSTSYGGNYKVLYYFLLISHIFLSVAVIPVVLLTYLHAWQGNFEKHKKWTRFAWPIWFYVAVSGVVVYLMIFPFYKFVS